MSTAAIAQTVLPARQRSPADTAGVSSESDYKHLAQVPTQPHHHSALGLQLPPPTSSSQPSMTRSHYPPQSSQPGSQVQTPQQAGGVKLEAQDSHCQYPQTTSAAPSTAATASVPVSVASHYPSSRQSPNSHHSQPLTPQTQHQQTGHSSQPSSQQPAAYGNAGLHHGSMPYFTPSYDHYQTSGPSGITALSRPYATPVYATHPGSIASPLPSLPSQDDQHHQTSSPGIFPPTMYYGVPPNQTPPQPYGIAGSPYNSMPMRHIPTTGAGPSGVGLGFVGQQSLYHPNSTPLQTASASTVSSNSTTPSALSAPSRLGSAQSTPTLPLQMPQNAAPGPIPATTPLVVRQDQNGVQWIAFEYSRDRVKMEYTIRCDVESVDVETLDPAFKTENCVYPRAYVPKEEYKGNRLHYESECNAVGWALAELNSALRGKRGLIQRAVDSWRNSNQDPRLRSRRVRRMAKNLQRQTESRKVQAEAQQQQQQQLGMSVAGAHHPGTHPAHRLSLPGMPGLPGLPVFGPNGYGSVGSGGAGMGIPSSGGPHHGIGRTVGPSVPSSLASFPTVSAGPGPLPLPMGTRHGVEGGMFSRA